MPIRFQRDGKVATITLDRPEKLNAMDAEMYEQISVRLKEIDGDDSIWVGIVTGAGDRAFTAGADLVGLHGAAGTESGWSATRPERFDLGLEVGKPLIAAVNGFCLAGGLELALVCDIRIASETATFGYPELPIGIPPSYASARAALPPAAARELCLTGRVIGADEAHRLGVVSEVWPDDELQGRALELSQRIAGMPRDAQLETKRRILADGERAFGELFAEEDRLFRETLLQGDPDAAA
jgi:enoyl-CoA hydratase/carnithine racemase